MTKRIRQIKFGRVGFLDNRKLHGVQVTVKPILQTLLRFRVVLWNDNKRFGCWNDVGAEDLLSRGCDRLHNHIQEGDVVGEHEVVEANSSQSACGFCKERFDKGQWHHNQSTKKPLRGAMLIPSAKARILTVCRKGLTQSVGRDCLCQWDCMFFHDWEVISDPDCEKDHQFLLLSIVLYRQRSSSRSRQQEGHFKVGPKIFEEKNSKDWCGSFRAIFTAEKVLEDERLCHYINRLHERHSSALLQACVQELCFRHLKV